MTRRTGKLRLTPDDHSETSQVGRSLQTKERPHGYPDAANIWRGAGPTHNLYEGADMQQSTRGPDPVDSRPRSSGVKITPPTHAGPVTTTHRVA